MKGIILLLQAKMAKEFIVLLLATFIGSLLALVPVLAVDHWMLGKLADRVLKELLEEFQVFNNMVKAALAEQRKEWDREHGKEG